MRLKRKNLLFLSLVVVLGIAATVAVMGVPYGRFSWTSVFAAQDSIYGGEPGCEIEIPAGSVVGRFSNTTPLYWEPSPGSATKYLVDIADEHKTAWVIGQDATNTFYKIIWVCEYYWVPKDVMGPNPDAVWGNTPLPTRVVK